MMISLVFRSKKIKYAEVPPVLYFLIFTEFVTQFGLWITLHDFLAKSEVGEIPARLGA